MKIIYFLSLLFLALPANAIKVASVNYQITGAKTLNQMLVKIDSFSEEAKKNGARYILFPELITFDLLPASPEEKLLPQLMKELSRKAKEYELGLIAIAKKRNITIIGASTLVPDHEGYFNRAYIARPNKKIESQDKNFPTPWEKILTVKETKKIQLFHDGDINFVILICYDSEFPSISAKLSNLKPDVIFVPSQTDNKYGLERVKRTSQARAIEHMAYVIMTGTTGSKSATWHTYLGQSFLFTPQNNYFPNKEQNGNTTESLSIFEIDSELIKKSRADQKQIYPARDEVKKI